MRSFVSDGASVMTGARNGVAKLLKDESPLILSFQVSYTTTAIHVKSHHLIAFLRASKVF